MYQAKNISAIKIAIMKNMDGSRYKSKHMLGMPSSTNQHQIVQISSPWPLKASVSQSIS